MPVYTLSQFKKWGAEGGRACGHRSLTPQKAREMKKISVALRAKRQEEATRQVPWSVSFDRANAVKHAWFGEGHPTLCGKAVRQGKFIRALLLSPGNGIITCRRCRGKLLLPFAKIEEKL